MLDWVSANRDGEDKAFLPEPYNWRTYGEMNVWFWKKHQNTELDVAKEMLAKSHKEVMALVETFTEEELFTQGIYK